MALGADERNPGNPRLIAKLAGAVLLLQLLVALVESVGTHVRDREFSQAQARISGLQEASTRALEVRVRFKLQVQEWKNVLLRGSDPTDFAKYRDAMQGHAAAVDATLLGLSESLAALREDSSAVAQLRERHIALAGRYAGVLEGRQRLDIMQALQADRDLRGIDRPLDADVDALADGLGARANDAREAALAAVQESIRRARWVRGVLLGCSSLVLVLLLLAALRRT